MIAVMYGEEDPYEAAEASKEQIKKMATRSLDKIRKAW